MGITKEQTNLIYKIIEETLKNVIPENYSLENIREIENNISEELFDGKIRGYESLYLLFHHPECDKILLPNNPSGKTNLNEIKKEVLRLIDWKLNEKLRSLNNSEYKISLTQSFKVGPDSDEYNINDAVKKSESFIIFNIRANALKLYLNDKEESKEDYKLVIQNLENYTFYFKNYNQIKFPQELKPTYFYSSKHAEFFAFCLVNIEGFKRLTQRNLDPDKIQNPISPEYLLDPENEGQTRWLIENSKEIIKYEKKYKKQSNKEIEWEIVSKEENDRIYLEWEFINTTYKTESPQEKRIKSVYNEFKKFKEDLEKNHDIGLAFDAIFVFLEKNCGYSLENSANNYVNSRDIFWIRQLFVKNVIAEKNLEKLESGDAKVFLEDITNFIYQEIKFAKFNEDEKCLNEHEIRNAIGDKFYYEKIMPLEIQDEHSKNVIYYAKIFGVALTTNVIGHLTYPYVKKFISKILPASSENLIRNIFGAIGGVIGLFAFAAAYKIYENNISLDDAKEKAQKKYKKDIEKGDDRKNYDHAEQILGNNSHKDALEQTR